MKYDEPKEEGSYSIFHGSTPALHGRQTEAKLVVLTIFRGLLCFGSPEVYPQKKLKTKKKKKKTSIESQEYYYASSSHHICERKAHFNYE